MEWTGRACGVNKRYMRNHRLSPDYRSFLESLAYTFRASLDMQNGQRPVFEGPVHVGIEQRSAHDVDALAKPILDSLETAGVIGNDRQVVRLNIKKEHKKRRSEEDRLTVVVWDDG